MLVGINCWRPSGLIGRELRRLAVQCVEKIGAFKTLTERGSRGGSAEDLDLRVPHNYTCLFEGTPCCVAPAGPPNCPCLLQVVHAHWMHVELCQVLLLMLRTAKLAALAVYLIVGAVFNVAVQAVKHNFGVNRTNTDGFTKVSGDVARHF